MAWLGSNVLLNYLGCHLQVESYDDVNHSWIKFATLATSRFSAQALNITDTVPNIFDAESIHKTTVTGGQCSIACALGCVYVRVLQYRRLIRGTDERGGLLPDRITAKGERRGCFIRLFSPRSSRPD